MLFLEKVPAVKPELPDYIEKLRQKLNQLASGHSLTDPSVLQLSRQLDRLILKLVRDTRGDEHHR